MRGAAARTGKPGARPARAVAPANIALIKYWGTADPARAIPLFPSLSMTLSRACSECHVEPATQDEVWLGPPGRAERAPTGFARGVLAQLDSLRHWSGRGDRFRVETWNSFPTGAGLASSASGFAALTLAVLRSWGVEFESALVSRLARDSGSGSAARSVLGGFVEWPGPVGDDGSFDPEGPAVQLAPADHWDLRDLIAVVDAREKSVSSREGHRRAVGSPLMDGRLQRLPGRFRTARTALLERDFPTLADTIEHEALEMHAVAMCSRPSILYWQPGTVAILHAVRAFRAAGVPCAFTIDAGPNVHVLCPADAEGEVASMIEALPAVQELLRDGVGPGPVSGAAPPAKAGP